MIGISRFEVTIKNCRSLIEKLIILDTISFVIDWNFSDSSAISDNYCQIFSLLVSGYNNRIIPYKVHRASWSFSNVVDSSP